MGVSNALGVDTYRRPETGNWQSVTVSGDPILEGLMMKSVTAIVFLTCLAVALSGCGPSEDELLREKVRESGREAGEQIWEGMLDNLDEEMGR